MTESNSAHEPFMPNLTAVNIPSSTTRSPSTGIALNTEVARCPNGCDANARDVDHATTPDMPWRVAACSHCHLLFTRIRPTEHALASFYGEQYHIRERIKPATRKRGGLLYPKPFGTRFALDVGCGDGEYMLRLNHLGWKVVGIEPRRSAAERAASKRIGDILESTFPSPALVGMTFDWITCQHALEHMVDPVGALASMRDLLREKGQILVSVPNSASWSARYFGPAWIGWDLPRHLTHFTLATLVAMVQRSGLSVVHASDVPQSGRIQKSARQSVQMGLRKGSIYRYRPLARWGASSARWGKRSDGLLVVARRSA
jgi:2-polyprenyl-3-methyl-5-hydroxy-6-metoxy-1,4-benzoquinol methylase